ncbi:HDOD domain-containing protein [Heliorestis convoluta]|uniref:HDOD domain-containing protein n=1 Tax=Heliorestis convoluta TaxID=356322 RepID=A0A5Q2N342_9FIRM|nr:HDOD domain-containing protein [Heliorestis convoluta]QGG48293.1 HDOD domain-containing protein [Heliorestis convoluta]
MVAGFLHDLGKVVLLQVDGFLEQWKEHMLYSNQNAFEVENKIVGTSHAEVGAYLLGLWGLPSMIGDAVAFHHNPCKISKETEWSNQPVVTAVYVANLLIRDKDTASFFLSLLARKDAGQATRWKEWTDYVLDCTEDVDES